jgi:hypothetical protein
VHWGQYTGNGAGFWAGWGCATPLLWDFSAKVLWTLGLWRVRSHARSHGDPIGSHGIPEVPLGSNWLWIAPIAVSRPPTRVFRSPVWAL